MLVRSVQIVMIDFQMRYKASANAVEHRLREAPLIDAPRPAAENVELSAFVSLDSNGRQQFVSLAADPPHSSPHPIHNARIQPYTLLHLSK